MRKFPFVGRDIRRAAIGHGGEAAAMRDLFALKRCTGMPRSISWQAVRVLSRPPVNMTSCGSSVISMMVSPP